ncbi:MAG: phage major tail tube protein [Culturomica sp.]|jgi:P2 family phage contractile tail tube protein|nr:phage major tail tube protein [Culturomica sp.]
MINSITNANAYLNGNKLAGKLEELELPAIKMKMEDVSALGLYGDTEIPVGMEKLEAKFKWNSVYRENWKDQSPFQATRLTVKSDMVTNAAGGQVQHNPVTVTIAGTFKEFPLGTLKAGAKQDGLEHTMTVTYLKVEVGGQPLYEVDVFNNVYKVGGTDQLSGFKSNT